jgi:tetratricopeptide (TPR) repeat protein/O-antigen ligase
LLAGLGAAATILALWPGTHSPSHDPKYLIVGLFPLALGVAWLVHCARRGTTVLATGLPFVFLIAFLALALIAGLASDHRSVSLIACSRFLALGLICFLVAQSCRTPVQAWQLLLWVGVAVAISSVYGLVQKVGWDPFPWAVRDVEEYRGLPATYGNPNVATHSVNLGLLILLGLSVRRGTRWCLILTIPVLLHLALTEVRAARVAVPAALCIAGLGYAVQRYTRNPRKSLALVLLFIAVIGATAIGGAMAFTKVATGSYLPGGHSLLLRYNGYYGACQMILDRPLLGFGPGTYAIENPPYWTPYEETSFATEAKFNANVHNEYLESAVDSGFGGAFLYIGFLASLVSLSLATAFTSEDRDRKVLAYTLAACFTAFAVDGLFGFNLRAPASGLLLFLLAGLMVGIAAPARTKPNRAATSRFTAPVLICLAGFVLAGAAITGFTSQVFRQKATAAATLGYPEQALIFLDKAERRRPWDAAILRQSAAVHASMGHTRESISDYRRALELNPNWVMDHVDLSRQYFQLTESEGMAFLERARVSAEHALALCSTWPEAHEMLGRIAIATALHDPQDSNRESQLREALGHFQQALRFGVRDREQLHRMTAQAHLLLGEVDLAENAYERAAELASGTDLTWTLFERFATESGRWQPYTNALNHALDRAKRQSNCREVARVLWWLSRAYATGMQDPALAAQALATGVRTCPDETVLWGAYVTLNRAEHDRARLKAILSYLEQTLEAPAVPPQQVAALIAYLDSPAANPVDQVRNFLDDWPPHATANMPEDRARAYGWLFSVYGSELATGTQLPEERGELLVRLGQSAVEIGAWPQANEILASAVPLLPRGFDVECLLMRVDVLERMERYAEARNVAQQASKRAPADFRTQHAVARQSALSGRTAEARLAYRLLLSRFALEAQTRTAVEQEMNALMGES